MYKAYAHRLPRFLSKRLFGDRQQFGLVPVESDPCWREWSSEYHRFYESTQKSGVGNRINNAGYEVLRGVDLGGHNVLEVGPGGLYHLPFWRQMPASYTLVDIDKNFLSAASHRLTKCGVEHDIRLSDRGQRGQLPAANGEFDAVLSFYSLEHLYPFADHFDEMLRVLKPGGLLVGAIPAEGGLAWGLGRFVTSRRWLKVNTGIDPDKIICWEHPTMADEIISTMAVSLEKQSLNFWPLRLPSIDINLVIRFVYRKAG